MRYTFEGRPIDQSFYAIRTASGEQAIQNGEALWGRFVCVPPAGSGDRSPPVWLHIAWVLRGGTWVREPTRDVAVEFLGKRSLAFASVDERNIFSPDVSTLPDVSHAEIIARSRYGCIDPQYFARRVRGYYLPTENFRPLEPTSYGALTLAFGG